ncbi:MAG: TRAP transporter substrate-binding protein DctP [Thermodesulfobacteriota bacterium]|nr:TRAP transporter substrate-binding protein DctP [Thermodesulfobacteriota bacterium]
MKCRRFFLVVLVFFVLFISNIALSKKATKKPKIVLKMANNAPIGIGVEVWIRKDFTPAVERATDGDVVLDWYSGGIMGDDEDWIAKMHIDQLQGAGLDGSGIHHACPDFAIMQLPFIFDGYDEVAFIKKRLRSKLGKRFEEHGYKMLVIADQDFDQVYSSKVEVRAPEDFARIKFLSYSGIVEQEMLKSLGASPVPISLAEANSAIRSGICNGIVIPSLWIVGAQVYTIIKNVTPSKMRYVMGSIVVTINAWNKIPEKHHKAVEEVSLDFEPKINQSVKDTMDRCLTALLKYGLKEAKLTAAEIEVLKKRTRPVWDKLSGKVYSRKMLNEILKHRAEYRSKKTMR